MEFTTSFLLPDILPASTNGSSVATNHSSVIRVDFQTEQYICVCVKLLERAWDALYRSGETGFSRKQSIRIFAVWLVISHWFLSSQRTVLSNGDSVYCAHLEAWRVYSAHLSLSLIHLSSPGKRPVDRGSGSERQASEGLPGTRPISC